MTSPRRGRQTPTQSVILPYTQTNGGEAAALYNSTGRTAQEWQELMLYDMLAVNDDGLWRHSKFGYAVPRRNGNLFASCEYKFKPGRKLDLIRDSCRALL